MLATQNPIEQEGTYPLPEAQLDRFMFMVMVNYPSRDEELEVLKRTTTGDPAKIESVIDGSKIVELQQIVRRVPVGDHAYHFALDLIRSTRPNEPSAGDFVKHWVNWGRGSACGAISNFSREGSGTNARTITRKVRRCGSGGRAGVTTSVDSHFQR